MGFDENSKGQPLVNPAKPDTKTNILMVIGVIVFFLIAAAVVIHYATDPAETRSESHREAEAEAGD